MNTKNKIILGNLIMFLISFLLPAYRLYGTDSSEPGYNCARFVSAALFHPDSKVNWWQDAMSELILIGTVIALLSFIPLSVSALLKNRISKFTAGLAMIICLPVGYWVCYAVVGRLQVGYFLWTLSYLVLAGAMFYYSKRATTSHGLPATSLSDASPACRYLSRLAALCTPIW